MSRVKRGYVRRRRHATTIGYAKGFRGKSQTWRNANQRVMKALVYSYTGRKQKKRDFRRLWISRINASLGAQGCTYANTQHQAYRRNVRLNRKTYAQMCLEDAGGFRAYVAALN